MKAHTEGPWELIGNQGTAIWAGNEIIAQMSKARTAHRQARIDAQLMAAAPELLEALRNLLVRCSTEMADPIDVHEIYAARLAIAKATQP